MLASRARRQGRAVALCVATALLGCGADPTTAAGDASADAPFDVVLPPSPLVARAVMWNASGADVGAVAALAEPDGLLVLFGARGMQVLAGGSVAAVDAQVTAWRAAGIIPAGDGTAGSWAVGLDDAGRVWRVRDRARLEDVTARYGLEMRRARSVAALSGGRVAFGLEGGVAVADGAHVTVWNDPAFATLVGGGARVAARNDAGVRVFDPATERMVQFAVAGVTGVAFDATEHLVVSAGSKLYVESDAGVLEARVASGPALRGVVRSGDRVWLAAGAQLALWDGRELHVAPDVAVPADARLLPSPGGDVWALSSAGLSRYGFLDSPDLRLWEDTVRPVFARRCVPCHLPDGTGNLNLTTYRAWQTSRAAIRMRAIVARSMPPPPGALTDAERAALSHWLDFDVGATDGGVDASADVASPDVASADASVDAAAFDAPPADRPPPVDRPPPADAGVDARDAPSGDARDAPASDARAGDAGVTYAAVNAIVQRACVRCHGASGGLDMSAPAAAYTALVNGLTAGAMCRGGGRVRVTPGDPSRSELYLKITGAPTCGVAMPRGGPMLPAADIETVRQWIAGGAPR